MNRAYFLTKGLSVCNHLTTWYHSAIESVKNLYTHMKSYWNGKTNQWVFMEGHTHPLPLSHVHNVVKPVWSYSSYCLTSNKDTVDSVCRLSWLSANIVIVDRYHEIKYDMDEFIERFRLVTHKQHCPTLMTIFLCWCAEKRQWFRGECIVQFHVITHEGKEETLTLRADNQSLEIVDNKIYYNMYRPQYENYLNKCTYFHA
jgi:hypothetical protein